MIGLYYLNYFLFFPIHIMYRILIGFDYLFGCSGLGIIHKNLRPHNGNRIHIIHYVSSILWNTNYFVSTVVSGIRCCAFQKYSSRSWSYVVLTNSIISVIDNGFSIRWYLEITHPSIFMYDYWEMMYRVKLTECERLPVTCNFRIDICVLLNGPC